jgi:hypothetical protein
MKPRALVFIPLVGFAAGWFLGEVRHAQFQADDLLPGGHVTAPSNITNSVADGKTAATNGSFALGEAAKNAPEHRRTESESLRAALSHPSALHRIGAFAVLLDGLTPSQFAALNAQLKQLRPVPEQSILTLFFQRWTQVAPEAALQAAPTEDLYYSALWTWAHRNPAAALAGCKQFASIHLFHTATLEDEILGFAMPKPGQLPPRDALRRIRELRGERKASRAVALAIGEILEDWAKIDPEAAWREALALPIEQGEGSSRERAIQVVLRQHAASNPQEALAWLKALPTDAEREMFEGTYVGALVTSGKARQAREYALALPQGPARQDAIGTLADALFQKDPETSKALIADLPDEDWRDPTALRRAIEWWVDNDDWRTAIAVFRRRFPADVPSGAAQDAAYDDMFDCFARDHPREASELFISLPERIGSKLLQMSILDFCEQDPAAAAEWVAALPQGTSREKLMGQVAENWTGFGAVQVTQWLDKLPPDSGKFAAIEGFAKATMSTSPDDALAWLHVVPDETERIERLRRVWQNWTDREAAQRWANTSRELSENERSALEKMSK